MSGGSYDLESVMRRLKDDPDMLERVGHVLGVDESRSHESLLESEDVLALVAPVLFGRDHERLVIVPVDAHMRPLGLIDFRGLPSRVVVSQVEVLRAVLRTERAAAWIMVHNHPNGKVEPSSEDIVLTRRLLLSARLIHLPLLDHLVVDESCKNYYSFEKSWSEWYLMPGEAMPGGAETPNEKVEAEAEPTETETEAPVGSSP